MQCIYCEASEARGVLLCYGCQVDLFPLISSWVYCGVCGTELHHRAICPQCMQGGGMPLPIVESVSSAPALAFSTSELRRSELPLLTKNKASMASPSWLEPLPKEPPVTRAEIKQARQFQWAIRSILVMFWMLIASLVLWWVRDWVKQPTDVIFP